MSQKTPVKNKGKKKKGRLGRFLLYSFLVLFILGIIATGAVMAVLRDIIADTPPIQNYDIYSMLEENSVVYDFQGNILQKVQDGGVRTIVPFHEIDQTIIDAFIAVEDKTFFEHSGFNYRRLVGAILEALQDGGSPSGTSTITQQYARNMYLTDTRFSKGQEGYIRKIKEAYYTLDLEKNLSKEEIITAYLNTIDFGGNVKGIQAASQRYFSKDANDIDYIEAAILAGIPKATSTFSPFTIKRNENVTETDFVLGEHDLEYTITFNESMLPRYATVIWVMRENGVISEAEYQFAKNIDIKTKLVPGNFVKEDISSYFIDMVVDDVINALMNEKNIGKEEATRLLYGGGLHIYSTLDTQMQRTLESSFNADDFNNSFDVATRRAAVAFQQKYSLGVDGSVGPGTLAKLAELDLLDIELMTQPVYREGMVHDEVIYLKQAFEKDGLLFKRNDKLPTVEVYRDARGNILTLVENSDGRAVGSRIMLNKHDEVVDENENFVIKPADFTFDANGNLVLYSNRTLDFFNVSNPDGTRGFEIFIKDTYKSDPSVERRLLGASTHYAERVSMQEMYIFKGRTIRVPFEFKTFDDSRNAVINKDFLSKNPDFYKVDEEGFLRISKDFYHIAKTGIIQPQAAMTVIDYRTGELRAIVGGRNITGQRIYNRALNPRQPGSAIKPLGVYVPALDNGLTAASVFDDVPRYDENNKRWPQNWYDHQEFKYWGTMTMREALEWSNNVIAVNVAQQLGIEKAYSYLKKFGFTTLVDTGSVNDKNLSAISLGGMSVGVTPLEITSAYGAIANGGLHNKTITFTRVLDKHGNVVLDQKAEQSYIVDEPVAYMMHDMMYTGANKALARTAVFSPNNAGIPIAGKTGTTSSKNDAWFIGYSPYYVAGIWIGNDIQVPLSDGSTVAARFWKEVAGLIHHGLPDKSFKTHEELGLIAVNVDNKSGKLPTPLTYRDPQGNTIIREWFIPGTQPTEEDDIHVEVRICTDSNRLATPYCPESSVTTRVMRLRLDENYNPYQNLEAGQSPYAIRDGQYTIPRSYVYPSEDMDYEAMALDPRSPFCFIHTGIQRTAYTTAEMLIGVQTAALPDGQLLIAQSIIVTTIHGTRFNVDAGSRINASGTIISTSGDTIYPWQLDKYEFNPDGPAYTHPEPTNPDGYGPPLETEPPLVEEP